MHTTGTFRITLGDRTLQQFFAVFKFKHAYDTLSMIHNVVNIIIITGHGWKISEKDRDWYITLSCACYHNLVKDVAEYSSLKLER